MGNALLGGELCCQRRYWLSKILVIFASCWERFSPPGDGIQSLRRVAGKRWPNLSAKHRESFSWTCDYRIFQALGSRPILKKHPVYRNVPILAATGSAGDIARQRCLSAGCDDFISKPFAISVLERRLTNLVSAETPKTYETAI